jgi:hypothetical protein
LPSLFASTHLTRSAMSPVHAVLDSENVFHSACPTVAIPDDIDCAALMFDYKPRRSDEVARTPLEGRTLFIDAISGRTVSFEEARHLTDGVAKVLKERLQLGWDDILALYSPSMLGYIRLFLRDTDTLSIHRRHNVRACLLGGSPNRCHRLLGQPGIQYAVYLDYLTEHRKCHLTLSSHPRRCRAWIPA